MNNVEEIELELIMSFLIIEFPRKKIKVNPKNTRFSSGIIVPPGYNKDGETKKYTMKTKEHLTALFIELHNIVLNVFSNFNSEIVNKALFIHLGIS